MRAELSAAIGFAVALAGVLATTPVAIRIAARTNFYDRPRGYRRHAAPTPFLGGAAVLAAFLPGAVAVGAVGKGYWILLAWTVAMWAVGTVDDRVAIPPRWRVLAETAAALVLYAAGLGWKLSGGDGVDCAATVIWVVGLVNAFNLMDNLDGACSTVGCISALGIGTLAAIHGAPVLAGMAFALAAACAGFLCWNLAGPAKIFLGDGGSMPVGFLVAGLGMATSQQLHIGAASLPAVALLAGVVILDTTLVTVSRTRRGVPIVTGGRDHVTHRLLARLRSARDVALTLALAQIVLDSAAIVGDQLGSDDATVLAVAVGVLGAVAIVVLDGERWRPVGIAVTQPPLPSQHTVAAELERVRIDPW